MSHLRPEDTAIVHRRSSCKRGRHRYGEPQSIGGGIVRQVCVVCSAVTIDLTGASDDPGSPSTAETQRPTSLPGFDR